MFCLVKEKDEWDKLKTDIVLTLKAVEKSIYEDTDIEGYVDYSLSICSRNNGVNKNGEITIDKTGKMEGRGAYICDDINCLEKAIKTKRLERTFNTKIEDEIYNKLRGVIID